MHSYVHTVQYSFTPPWIAATLVGIVIYFIPSIIAKRRKHKNRVAIYVLNFFLGGSGLGWVIALVWSLTDNVE